MPLTKTRALIADLASATGSGELQADDNGGFQLTIGGDVPVLLYGGDDATLLVVLPVCPLPPQPDYATVAYLLGLNTMQSAITPFQIGMDEGGGLILWARLPIAALDGEALAGVVDALADSVTEIRQELYPQADTEAA